MYVVRSTEDHSGRVYPFDRSVRGNAAQRLHWASGVPRLDGRELLLRGGARVLQAP